MATENPIRLPHEKESSPREEDLRAPEWMLIRTHPGKARFVAEQLKTRVKTFIPYDKKLSPGKRMIDLYPNCVFVRVDENVPTTWIKTRHGVNFVVPTLVSDSDVEEIKNGPNHPFSHQNPSAEQQILAVLETAKKT